jgi:60S ribosomal subunit assembly/export protein LOC1
MRTILAIVQAEKEGHIESKILKARQMEEIREARRIEAEKKEEEKKAKLEDVKDSLRKKRKRKDNTELGREESIKALTSTGSKAAKPKLNKKKVSFA